MFEISPVFFNSKNYIGALYRPDQLKSSAIVKAICYEYALPRCINITSAFVSGAVGKEKIKFVSKDPD